MHSRDMEVGALGLVVQSYIEQHFFNRGRPASEMLYRFKLYHVRWTREYQISCPT